VFAVIELDQCNLAVAINKGLLVNPANSLDIANVVGVLAAQITRVFGFNFTVGFE
jgi:hypothetical protein